MRKSLLETAIKAAIEAGIETMKIYNSDDFDVDFKADDSPLTRADLASHKIIDSFLQKTSIPILSEEGKEIPYSERSKWKQLWIVDPIDGTKEFIKKNGEFTVNIALVEDQQPTLGVIYVPAQDLLYFSTKELGAYKLNNCTEPRSLDDTLGRAQQLPLKKGNRPFTVVASRSHLSKETQAYISDLENQHGEVVCISKGSSLKLCMIAEGTADCYPRFAPTMEWDTAAGQAICMHAGFNLIDWNTKSSMLYNREHLLNGWFIVQ